MRTVAILASGPSLTDEDVAYIKAAREDGRLHAVIAISNVGLDKAPWADALASHDSKWWTGHERQALEFKGRKFSARGYQHTEGFSLRNSGVWSSCNSGCFGMYIARDEYEAEKIILLGFDMHRRNGAHYFGPHTALVGGKPLSNTDAKKFRFHISQFAAFRGAEVINCTIGSDLKKFPIMPLRDIL